MSSILHRIALDTAALVKRRKREIPMSALQDMPGFSSPRRPFGRVLRGHTLAIIAEFKRASPSKGLLDMDRAVHEIAFDYQTNGASAMSVLTEPFHFRGALQDLEAARSACDLPLLRKDFVIDPYQLAEARAFGADAVLLIAAILDSIQLVELQRGAEELGLECLVEVYDPEELDKIDFQVTNIVGVNNRDLNTFAVDISRSIRILAKVPQHVVRVSESGLRTSADLHAVRRAGIDAVLVGETFMRSENPGATLGNLRSDLSRLDASTS